MSTEKRMSKPVKAWAIVDKEGSVWAVRMFKKNASDLASSMIHAPNVIRVLITPLESGK